MLIRCLYSGLVLPLALVLALPVAIFHRKLRRSLLARVGVWGRLAQAASLRDAARPLVWFHVSSAGELLQAEPVLRRCADAGAQVAVTLTSFSALRWRERLRDVPELVWADAMPLDFSWAVRRVWRVLRPTVLVYVQADLWPGMVLEVERLGTPQVLIAARLRNGSLRTRRTPLRQVYRRLYRALAAILTLGESDRATLEALIPDHPVLRVGGDPGIETAVRRVQSAAAVVLPPPFHAPGASVLVAGSIRPADAARLMPVLTEALGAFPHLSVVLAPHDPDESHLLPLESALAPLAVARLSGLAEAPALQETRVVLVDTVGQLAGLYRAGTVAYVGGAFSTGVHNVAEPAAAGLPICFGPRHRNSAVAAQLLLASGAIEVSDQEQLRAALWPLLADPDVARTAGISARETVTLLSGAAEEAFTVLRQLVTAL